MHNVVPVKLAGLRVEIQLQVGMQWLWISISMFLVEIAPRFFIWYVLSLSTPWCLTSGKIWILDIIWTSIVTWFHNEAWFVLRHWWSKVAGNCFGKRMALDNLHATEMRKANDEAMEKMDGQEKCVEDRNQREGLLIYLSILGMFVRSCNLKFNYVCLGIDMNNAS